jgi:photosystem II stability/assembly factor-like uncharacterized protein
MKHLKKTPAFLLLMLLTVITGSWTYDQGFSGTYLFDNAQHDVRANVATQDSVHHKAQETTNIVFQSTDGGQTWHDISQGLPEHTGLEDFFAGESELYVRINNVMYRSKSNLKTPVWEKEGGKTWKQVQNEGGVMDRVESEGVLIATDQKGIMRSIDNGEHWQWVISEGGVGIAVERIDGGFAAISYSSITQSRRIRISMDAGKTWTPIDENLPPSLSISSIKQVGNSLLCGHPDGIFRSPDMGKTWKLVHPGVDNALTVSGNAGTVTSSIDYTFTLTDKTRNPENDKRRVFKLYVSGNVLYAVARHFGC